LIRKRAGLSSRGYHNIVMAAQRIDRNIPTVSTWCRPCVCRSCLHPIGFCSTSAPVHRPS
jgi:hypothetical protein